MHYTARCLALILTCLTSVRLEAQDPSAKTLAQYEKRRAALVKTEAQSTVTIAKSCLKTGMIEEARWWLDHTLRLAPHHEQASALRAAKHEKHEVNARVRKSYDKRRATLIKKMARSRVRLAQWCVRSGLEQRARDLYGEVLVFDPDNVVARDACGFTRYDGAWLPKDEVALRQSGHLPFGPFWVTKNEHEALIAGKYPVGIEHLPIAEVDAVRRSMDQPWSMRSRHFTIRSNLRLQEIDQIVKRLERAYDVIPRYFGLTPAAPPVTYAVTWTRTKSDLETVVGPVRADCWYEDRKCATFCNDQANKLRAPQLLFELLLVSGSGASVDKVKATSGAWAVVGASRLIRHVRPKSSASVFDLDGLQQELGRKAHEYFEKHDNEALVRLNARHEAGGESDHTTWSAASARLVAYLLQEDGGRHAAAFKRYLRRVAEGRGSVELFEATFGLPIRKLQDPVRQHLFGF